MVKPDELKRVLIDRRNYAAMRSKLLAEFAADRFTGIDLETHNANAHAGIALFEKEHPKTNVFDTRRTVITGLSLYKDGSDTAYYFNLNQLDKGNRLTWPEVRDILDANVGYWIAHNAVFERTMLLAVYNYDLHDERIIDTLQMAVSAYNQDQYDTHLLRTQGITAFEPILGKASVEFSTFIDRQHMTSGQSEVLGQVIGKSSKAAFSYNGLVKSIAYGYGLKAAVMSFFGFRMETFDEVLAKAGAEHMGEVTGDQVVSYGADDSYWAVRLFYRLKEFMLETNPKVLTTFLKQENPMVSVYSNVWKDGIRINKPAVKARQAVERDLYAEELRKLKLLIKSILPFASDPHQGLIDDDKMYAKSYQKYRDRLTDWCSTSDDGKSSYEVVRQISGPVSKSWTADMNEEKESDLNLDYYMTQRVIMYDLFGQNCIKYKGKVQSDGEARGKLMEKLSGTQLEIMKTIGAMMTIGQSMKLYLNPYMQLIDPETDRIYPQLSSMLNTRRMAMSFPNPQQLSKRSSTYVRGFYLPDEEDQVIVSLDWSSFELVIIGELSRDPEFAAVFGQLPFGDLHTGAAVDVLNVATAPGLTEAYFNGLSKMDAATINKDFPKLLIKPNGDPLTPDKAKKFWRVEIGKGANFNYWYSGALSTVGDKLGWDSDTMWKATEAYRERFSVAEKWRTDTITQLQIDGYLELPDGHRRVRYEATPEFGQFLQGQFSARERLLGIGNKGLSTFGNVVTRSLQSRANNQGINALVQGTNAFVAKRSIKAIIAGIMEQGLRARFLMPIHDEVVFSCHREDAVKLIALAKYVMRHHEDVFKTLKLDCTASIGRTFEPWSPKTPQGQIELDEMPDILGIGVGSQADNEQTQRVIDEYLFA